MNDGKLNAEEGKRDIARDKVRYAKVDECEGMRRG
jgi:hypothetical protein